MSTAAIARTPAARKIMAFATGGQPFTIPVVCAATNVTVSSCRTLLSALRRAGEIESVRPGYGGPAVYWKAGLIAPSAEQIEAARAAAAEVKATTSARLRPCLTCRKPFHSEGAHNRLCGTCSPAVAALADSFGGAA